MNSARPHIHFIVHNKFFRRDLIEISMPYNPIKAMFGKYSSMCRKIKSSISQGEKTNFIRIKFFKKSETHNRMIITLASGMTLNMPDNLTDFDLEIIKAQLNVLKMPFQNEK